MVFFLGAMIGAVLGLTGAGGSVFALPMLVMLLGLPISQATGLSLGAVAVSALFGMLLKWRSGQILWRHAGIFALVGSLSTPIGAYLNGQLNDKFLSLGFAFLVMIVAMRMWRQAIRSPESAQVVRAATTSSSPNEVSCVGDDGQYMFGRLPCFIPLLIGAFATGILSGLFGVGGGFLIVPLLMHITSATIQQAVATSLVVISLVSSSGLASFIFYGNTVEAKLLLPLLLGGVSGMAIGFLLSRNIASANLQKGFSVLLGCIVIVYLTFIFLR